MIIMKFSETPTIPIPMQMAPAVSSSSWITASGGRWRRKTTSTIASTQIMTPITIGIYNMRQSLIKMESPLVNIKRAGMRNASRSLGRTGMVLLSKRQMQKVIRRMHILLPTAQWQSSRERTRRVRKRLTIPTTSQVGLLLSVL